MLKYTPARYCKKYPLSKNNRKNNRMFLPDQSDSCQKNDKCCLY